MRPGELYEAMQSVPPEFLEESEMYNRKRSLPRALLIAAALALCTAGAAAAGASLETRDDTCQWDIGSLDYGRAYTLGVEHIAFGLTLRRGLEPVCQYAPVEIPVTPAGTLCAEIGVPLPQDGYRGEMRAVGVQVHASYVEVDFAFSPFQAVAAPAELADTEDIRYPDGRVENPTRDALVEYLDSLSLRADAALADTALHYADGSSKLIAAMPSQYTGSWVHDLEGTLEALRAQDSAALRHVTRQAVDLSQAVSVTIGGVSCPLR